MTELVQPIKRVEQYLYALCVLDFSNIPVPRSRLEIFTHAMITGEIPEIAPETREEEYMVAIIKGDVSNLPTPKSRADHLLYRICLGETEIRDVELETRYEMLLAYLAEHGGTDLEYALINYTKAFETLYNTVEMPFKSAILTGQTLVNLTKNFKYQTGWMNIWGGESKNTQRCCYQVENAKDGTKYLVKTFGESTQAFIRYYDNSDENPLVESGWLNLPAIITTPSNTKKFAVTIRISTNNEDYTSAEQANKNLVIEYQDGMENWDISYFEGMQSVKMPVLTTVGKNLFNTGIENGLIDGSTGNIAYHENYGRTIDYISINPNMVLTASSDGISPYAVFYYDKNKNYIGVEKIPTSNFTTPNNCYFIKMTWTKTNIDISLITNVQLEQGTVATSYEPYKSNILTVNEDVTLRGIGNVKDTLDCLNGQMTERIAEIVLDGSEGWESHTDKTNTKVFKLTVNNLKYIDHHIISDRFPTNASGDVEKITNTGNVVYVAILKSKADNLKNFKSYLSQNPITVQYQLATESIKTVVLNIQDQDNQPTTLKTFNDVTHIETQADSVLPTVILEYGTKNQEALAALSQDHEEVADAQAALSDAIDSQSDEVETTMMALTEVYEGRNEE